MDLFLNGIASFLQNTGIAKIFAATPDTAVQFAGIDFGAIIMIAISCVLIFLAIGKKFELSLIHI